MNDLPKGIRKVDPIRTKIEGNIRVIRRMNVKTKIVEKKKGIKTKTKKKKEEEEKGMVKKKKIENMTKKKEGKRMRKITEEKRIEKTKIRIKIVVVKKTRKGGETKMVMTRKIVKRDRRKKVAKMMIASGKESQGIKKKIEMLIKKIELNAKIKKDVVENMTMRVMKMIVGVKRIVKVDLKTRAKIEKHQVRRNLKKIVRLR